MAYKLEIQQLISAQQSSFEAIHRIKHTLERLTDSMGGYQQLVDNTSKYTANDQATVSRVLLAAEQVKIDTDVARLLTDVQAFTYPTIDTYWDVNIATSAGLTNP